jgi:hypothetical protein
MPWYVTNAKTLRLQHFHLECASCYQGGDRIKINEL